MEIKELSLKGVFEITPKVFGDPRGYFFESYRKDLMLEAGIEAEFVQDNQSYSTAGVVRGIHIQLPPFSQGKLVRVVSGRVIDIAVDLRPGSVQFGQWVSVELSGEKNNLLWIPEGFGHGFSTLEDAVFTYKCTNYYNKASESGVLWNDPELNIDWGIQNPIVSEKDAILPSLKEFLKVIKS